MNNLRFVHIICTCIFIVWIINIIFPFLGNPKQNYWLGLNNLVISAKIMIFVSGIGIIYYRTMIEEMAKKTVKKPPSFLVKLKI